MSAEGTTGVPGKLLLLQCRRCSKESIIEKSNTKLLLNELQCVKCGTGLGLDEKLAVYKLDGIEEQVVDQ